MFEERAVGRYATQRYEITCSYVVCGGGHVCGRYVCLAMNLIVGTTNGFFSSLSFFLSFNANKCRDMNYAETANTANSLCSVILLRNYRWYNG